MTLDGLHIHYICEGHGQPVIFLHGWNAGVQVYSGVFQTLTKRCQVIAPDMPGAGESDEPPEPWTVDQYADFVLHFLHSFPEHDRVDWNHVILMGHSFGCRVIIKLMNRPELPFTVDKIIVTDGAGIKPVPTHRQKWRTRLFKVGKWFCLTPPVKKFFPNALHSLQTRFGSADYARATPVMRQTLVKVVNEDLTHLLPGVHAETLLIWGDRDTATPLSDGQKMESLMPNAGLAVIREAGHFAFLDQPVIFSKILSSYLHLDEPDISTDEHAETVSTEENTETVSTDEPDKHIPSDISTVENTETVSTDENTETLSTDEPDKHIPSDEKKIASESET